MLSGIPVLTKRVSHRGGIPGVMISNATILDTTILDVVT
jgi:hypothetical protein